MKAETARVGWVEAIAETHHNPRRRMMGLLVPKLQLGNPGREAPASRLLHQTRITSINQVFLSGIIPGTGTPPMLGLVDIAAFDRVLMDIIQFLAHHYLGFDELRVTAFLPNLISAFGLVRTLEEG